MSELVARSPFSVWMQAVRAFSFTASIVPVLVGAALAAVSASDVYWTLIPLILVCSVLIQAATNLVSDYFDYKNGVDTVDSYGSSRVLVEKLIEPTKVLRMGLLFFTISFLLGLIMVYIRGVPILWLGIIGILGGYFYCGGGKLAYKYFAIGDPMVFMLMGTLMVCGAFYVLTGDLNNTVILASLPVGCLVTAILVANNIRDIVHDRLAGTKTLSTVLGPQGAKLEYAVLVLGAYAIVVILVVLHSISPWTLLVFASLPPALKNVLSILKSDPITSPEGIMMVDAQTAQHHLMFGVLYSIGFVLPLWI